ncbi:MAG: hypothetical protein FWF88_12175 [Peptococcaceae bacterium]|jgi:peptidoglycan hydrolase CwlO-like protein|nr:hypothetical protein [Peptococcaceae bacterium]MDR2736143.1 hypothetical protein [Gracilibacteraceae bacterium]
MLTKEDMQTMKAMMEEVVAPIKTDLDGVKSELSEVKQKVDAVDAKVDAVDAKVDAVDAKVDAVDKRLRKLEIKVEHQINSSLKATMEGLAGVTEKMHSVLAVENRVETLEHKTSAIEFYIKKQQAQS